MNFSINELPEKQLELIGLTKKAILNMPPRTYNALMSGNRTSLIRFNKLNVPGLEGGSLDAKLSLERKPDNSVSIRFHPINQMPKNTFNLTKDEIEQLKAGINFIEKKLPDGKEHLIGIDQQTNEFVAIVKDSIESPKKINGIELTDDQVKNFKEGKDIKVGGEKFRLNPNDELGISATSKNSMISNLEFKHSKYNSSELLIDLALLTTGAGSVFMIGHLADLLIHTSAATLKGKKDNNISQLVNENKTLRDALAKASPDIAHKFEKGEFLTPKELKQMVENHLDLQLEIGAINDLEFKAGYPTGVNAGATDGNNIEEVKQGQKQDIQITPRKTGEETKEERAEKTEVVSEQSRKNLSIKM
ncbi:MAG: DUF3945 domain-containing protein [Bacteroidota bacterium]|nr:DUF3945 domain-containing protein [Bacteroidota bacterium]